MSLFQVFPNYLSCSCDQIPNKRNLRGERFALACALRVQPSWKGQHNRRNVVGEQECGAACSCLGRSRDRQNRKGCEPVNLRACHSRHLFFPVRIQLLKQCHQVETNVPTHEPARVISYPNHATYLCSFVKAHWLVVLGSLLLA